MERKDEELLTIRELADALKIPPTTIYYLHKKSDWPVFRVGRHLRFRLGDVLAHLEEK
jgi:excisionase family DNA binding protein